MKWGGFPAGFLPFSCSRLLPLRKLAPAPARRSAWLLLALPLLTFLLTTTPLPPGGSLAQAATAEPGRQLVTPAGAVVKAVVGVGYPVLPTYCRAMPWPLQLALVEAPPPPLSKTTPAQQSHKVILGLVLAGLLVVAGPKLILAQMAPLTLAGLALRAVLWLEALVVAALVLLSASVVLEVPVQEMLAVAGVALMVGAQGLPPEAITQTERAVVPEEPAPVAMGRLLLALGVPEVAALR